MLTLVFPVRKLEKERLDNFKFLLKYYSKSNLPIIVAEQVSDSKELVTFIKDLKNPKINHILCPISANMIMKSTLINEALRHTTTDYFWMIDADVYLDYNKVKVQVSKSLSTAYKPFSRVLRISYEQTREFIDKGSLKLTKGTKVSSCTLFGPISFLLKTKFFRDIGGMDDTFKGFGWEDLDLRNRVKKVAKIIEEIPVVGLHLHHESVKGLNTQESANRNVYLSKKVKKTNLVFKEDKLTEKIFTLAKKEKDENKQYFNVDDKVKITHVTSPALISQKKSLWNRELLTLESILLAKTKTIHTVTPILVSESPNIDEQKNFIIKKEFSHSGEIGDVKHLPKLNSLLKVALENKDDIILYTNSDCCLKEDAYNKIVKKLGDKDVLLLHRLEVLDSPVELKQVLNYRKKVFDLGIDGIAYKREFLEKSIDKIPDFFIGEPHWDTAMGSFYDILGVSNHDASILCHPSHDLSWDIHNLSLAGRHNDSIYQDMIAYGQCVRVLPEIMASVVMVHYGRDEKRLKAVRENLSWIKRQALRGEYIFIEARDEDGTDFPDLKAQGFRHIVIKMHEENKDLWQKEQMMNIGLEFATFGIVVFVDSDVHCKDESWLYDIARKVHDDDRNMVQGYRIISDSEYPNDWSFLSYGARMNGIDSSLPNNPGICWGVSKKLIGNIGFNPYCLYGNGDSLIIAEFFGKDYPSICMDWCVKNYSRMAELVRNINIDVMPCYVDHDITHINHGKPLNLEEYGKKNEISKSFTKSMRELVEIDSRNKLLKWKDLECLERKLVRDLKKSAN